MAREDYSSYVPTAGVDWAKITEDLIGKVNTVGTNIIENREALDLMESNANDLMNKDQLYSSQDFNNLMFSAAGTGREQIAKWKAEVKAGTLSPQGFKRRTNNLQNKWSTLANSAKTYDNVNKEFMKRQTPDQASGLSDGSEYEQYLSMIHTELGELANKKIYFDPNTGEPYIAKFDKDGNIDPTSMTPTFRYAVPNNFYDNTVNFETIISNGTKGLAEYTIENGVSTITDPLANKATQKAIVSLQNTVLNNDRWVNQVLAKFPTENYDWYRTEEEKKSKISAMIDVEKQTRSEFGGEAYTEEEIKKLYSTFEKQMILVAPDGTGTYQPMITEEQRKVAADIIMDKIKSQIGYQKSLDEPNYGSSGSSKSDDKKDEDAIPSVVQEAYTAFVGGDTSTLSSLTGGKQFIYVKGKGLGLKPDDEKDQPTRFFKNIKDMYDLFGYGSADGKEKFRGWIDEIYSQKNAAIQSATNADWIKAGWTQEQINQAVKLGKIKVIK